MSPTSGEAMARSVIEGGLSKAPAAREFRTTPKTIAKWVERFRMEGVAGLRDRSSRPLSSPGQATACRLRGGRGFAKAAPHRRADCRRGRRFARYRHPHPET